jgi:hypothetical protein
MGRTGTIALVLVATLLLALVGAGAASGGVRVLRPSSTLCAGERIKVGVRYRTGSSRAFKLIVTDPAGKKILSKRGRASNRWKYWSVRVPGPGVFRTLYRIPQGKRRFSTKAVDCTAAPPANGNPGSGPGSGPPAPPTHLELRSNDGGLPLFFALRPAAPSDPPQTACLLVSYTGTVPVTLRMYGATSGSGLDSYLNMTVTRGSLPSLTAGSCSSFTPDPIDYVGAGPGVVYRGTLSGYPDDYLSGLVDPVPGSPESWTAEERHAYRFTVSVRDDNGAQGLTAGQTFVWEARDG